MTKRILYSKTVQTQNGKTTYVVTESNNAVMVERKVGDEMNMVCGTHGIDDGIQIVDKIAATLCK